MLTTGEVYHMPGHLFRRMQQIAVAIFMEECADSDLTPVQFAALVAIGEHPGIDATRLSSTIAFDKSTLGSVLDRLQAKAMVDRRPTPTDRRLKLLYLTARGRDVLAAVGPSVRRAQERMLASLSATDRRKLISLLSELVDINNVASRATLRLTAAR